MQPANRQPTKEYVRNYEQNMQNKPNFPDGQINLSANITRDYENKSNPTLGENKPNSKPIQTQTNPISETPKINISSIVTKYYENIYPCAAPKNKPKTNPISQEPRNERKLIVNKGLSKPALRSLPENKPNQSQFQKE